MQILATAGLGLAAYFWIRQLDGAQLGRALAQAKPLPLVLVAFVALGCVAWKAAFWHFALSTLRPVPFRALLRYAIAATVGSILAPARAGDAFRVWILHRRHDVPLPATLTVVGLEKLGDVGALVLLVAPLPWLVPELPAAARPWLLGLSGVPVAAGVAIAVVRRHPRWSRLSVFAGLRVFDRASPLLLALGSILMAWLFDLAAIELVLHAVGAKPTLGAGLMVLLLVNLAIAVPLTPGNAGAHELGSAVALKMMGVEAEIATAFALLYHGLNTIPVLVVGFVDARRLLAAGGGRIEGGERDGGAAFPMSARRPRAPFGTEAESSGWRSPANRHSIAGSKPISWPSEALLARHPRCHARRAVPAVARLFPPGYVPGR
ncbi:MAG TPA: lysylphosphatidylglycerol synthase transmembrane domain-containing protein, partial [Usitatibacter sp.]|nr:lysylphosphatidylglycerol synthase transmembrane domain-containing protein [Usitatibacter sp.]